MTRFSLRAEGYGPRFGVTYVDYETLKRYPKDSARFLLKASPRRCIVFHGIDMPPSGLKNTSPQSKPPIGCALA